MTHEYRPRLALALLGAAFTVSALAAAPAATAAAAVAPALDLSGIDKSVAPGDDFFRYANGTWLNSVQIPPDRSSWSTSAALTELTAQRTADLIKEAAAASAAGSEARKVGDYYATFMDEAAIERLGAQPLATGLKRIDAIKDRHELARALGETLRADVDVLNSTNFHTENLFGLWVAQDLSDPTRYAPFLLQGGLVMPDRDYYLNPAQKMADIRSQYLAHIARVLALAQLPDSAGKAAHIFALEHSIAEVHWSRAQGEDVLKGNNHWNRQDFPKQGPRPGLDGVLHRGGSERADAIRGVAAERRHGHGRARGQRPARGMEGLPALSSDRGQERLPLQGIRR